MAATGKVALGLSLGVDFSALGADLNKVADRIDALGKQHSLKLGSTVADAAGGQLDPAKLGGMVAEVGTMLSSGVAEGVRASSALLVGMGVHINSVLDRMAGALITMARRADAAMKFPIFDSAMKTAQLRLTNFTRIIGRKPLTPLDEALGGAMGKTIQNIAKIARQLFMGLAAILQATFKGVGSAITGELGRVTAELSKVVEKLGQAKSEAEGTVPIFGEMAAAAAQAAAPPPAAAGPLPPRSKVPGFGRRIGFGTDFTAPAPAPFEPSRRQPKSDLLADFKRMGVDAANAVRPAVARIVPALDAVRKGGLLAGRTFLQVGAAFISVPLRAVIGIYRLRNFLTSLGDVGKKSFHDIYESHGVFAGSVLAGVKVVRGLAVGLLRVGTLGVFGRHAKDADGAARSAGRFGSAVGGSALTLRGLGATAVSVGRQVLQAFELGFIIFRVVGFLRSGVKAASALNETVSRSKVVFGDSFGVVQAQANAMSKAFGITRDAQLDVAAGFGAMAQGAGMSEAASADLANRMTKMAADLSSSVNIPFAEAGEKIRSALAGESMPLREFGVLLSEDAVKAYALAHGMAGAGGAISDQTKIAARAALVTQGLSYAQGDLERTSDSAANQFRKAGGGLTEFGERIGELLLPAVQAATEGFNEFLAVAIEAFEGSMATLESWGAAAKAVFDSVGMLVRNFSAFVQIAKLRIGAFVANTIAWIGVLPENFTRVTSYIGENWRDLLTDLVSAARAAFTNLLENAGKLGTAIWDALEGKGFHVDFTPLLKGFARTAKEFPGLVTPELLDVEDQVGEILAGITAKEDERAKTIAAAGKPAAKKRPGAAAEADKVPEYKLAGAVEVGSKEAYSAIAKNAAGGSSTTGAVQKLHGTAKDMNANLKELVRQGQGRPPAAPAFAVR